MSWSVVAQSLSGLSVIRSAASFSKSQADKGEQALSHAFSPPPPTEQKVLFYLPVTKAWLQQVVLGLVLLCHSSFRGMVKLFRDVLDCPVALGSIHS
jgi:hypothetical protein